MSTMNLVLYGLAAWLLIGAAYSLTNYFRLFKKSWTEPEADTNIMLAKFGLICDCWITSFAVAIVVIANIWMLNIFYEIVIYFLDNGKLPDNGKHLNTVQLENSVKLLLDDYYTAIGFIVFFVVLINTVASITSAYYWLKRNNKKSDSDLFKKNLSWRLIGYFFAILPLFIITVTLLES